MPIIDNKILTPITYVQDLSRHPTPSEAMTYQQLQAKLDQGSEDLRVKHNSLIDDIITSNTAKDTSIATAVTTANNAVTTANNAVTTANSSDTKADNAIVTANSADVKADNAISTANDALIVAADAQLGTIANNSLTEAKMANEMKKDIAGGVASYNGFVSSLADNSKQVPHLGTTTNVVDAYSITTTQIINANQKFTIKINVASTTSPTLKINSGSAYAVKKANGNNAKLYASVYTFFWDGTNFIQLGEGGDYGTATIDNVLVGSTIGTENGVVGGTMPDLGNGYVVRGTAWTDKNWIQRPSQDVIDVEFLSDQTGKIDTGTKYELGIMNLVPKNIVEGVSISVGANGMTGTAPIPIPLISGTSVVLNSGVVETYSLTPAKVFEKTALAKGTVRVGTFLDSVYYVDTVVYCRIYKNGIAVGTTRTKITSISPIQYYDDIAINKGDLIQVFGWTNMGTKASKVTVTLEIGNSFFQ